MKEEVYCFFDLETTGRYTPNINTMITCAMYVTDSSYNILGEFYEKCTVGKHRYIKNILGHEVDLWPYDAEKVHGITWQEQLSFQSPIDFHRKLYVFLEKFKDKKLRMIYHANGSFDPKHLLYHAEIHAPKMYRYLSKRFSEYIPNPLEGTYIVGNREDNTMSMAREYMKSGKDILKQITKAEKTIKKMTDYLTKERKTPAKPSKIQEWKDKRSEAENTLATLECAHVQFEGVGLDSLCKALGIELDHHNAQSDAKALIPIHQFLVNN